VKNVPLFRNPMQENESMILRSDSWDQEAQVAPAPEKEI